MPPSPDFCLEAIGPVATDSAALTYLRNFICNLEPSARERTQLLVSSPIPKDVELEGVSVHTLPRITGTGVGKVIGVQMLAPLLIHRMKTSAVYCSGTIAPALGFGSHGPKVVVNVQNAAALDDTRILGDRWRHFYRRVALPAGLRRASQVITTSQVMKDAIVERYGIGEELVAVVPLGVDTSIFYPDDKRAESPGRTFNFPFILFVSVLWDYKNASTLVAAYARLVADGSFSHKLVIVGPDGGEEASLRSQATSMGLGERVLFMGRVDGLKLAKLYREASLFVYPSLLESFGLPVLEAMASGTPVVASNRWAVPEICGDAALICDPSDTDELATAIATVLSAHEFRQKLVERGFVRVKQFSWRQTVDKTLAVIEEAVKT